MSAAGQVADPGISLSGEIRSAGQHPRRRVASPCPHWPEARRLAVEGFLSVVRMPAGDAGQWQGAKFQRVAQGIAFADGLRAGVDAFDVLRGGFRGAGSQLALG